MNYKKLFWIVFCLLIIVLGTSSYYGGSNFSSYLGYPTFDDYKPTKPYVSSFDKTIEKWKYDSYKREVENYLSKAKEYIKYASNDILSIGDAQDKAIDDANMVVDEFNSFAKSVTVVTSY